MADDIIPDVIVPESVTAEPPIAAVSTPGTSAFSSNTQVFTLMQALVDSGMAAGISSTTDDRFLTHEQREEKYRSLPALIQAQIYEVRSQIADLKDQAQTLQLLIDQTQFKLTTAEQRYSAVKTENDKDKQTLAQKIKQRDVEIAQINKNNEEIEKNNQEIAKLREKPEAGTKTESSTQAALDNAKAEMNKFNNEANISQAAFDEFMFEVYAYGDLPENMITINHSHDGNEEYAVRLPVYKEKDQNGQDQYYYTVEDEKHIVTDQETLEHIRKQIEDKKLPASDATFDQDREYIDAYVYDAEQALHAAEKANEFYAKASKEKENVEKFSQELGSEQTAEQQKRDELTKNAADQQKINEELAKALERRNELLKADNAERQGRVDQANKEIAGLETNISARDQELAKLETEIKGYKETLIDLNKQKAAVEAALVVLEEKLKTLETALNQSREYLSGYLTAFQTTKSEFTNTVEKLQNSERIYSVNLEKIKDSDVITVTQGYDNGQLEHAVRGHKDNYYYIDRDGKEISLSNAEVEKLKKETKGMTVEESGDPSLIAAAQAIQKSGKETLQTAETVKKNLDTQSESDRAAAEAVLNTPKLKVMCDGNTCRLVPEETPDAVKDTAKQPTLKVEPLFKGIEPQAVAEPSLENVPVIATANYTASSGINADGTPKDMQNIDQFNTASNPDTLASADNLLKQKVNYAPSV